MTYLKKNYSYHITKGNDSNYNYCNSKNTEFLLY